ncbi:Protein of unknown function DUF3328 [Penicillium occitanis (nom. inval.)]|nr:Protein of unknown function DUF3328 [Penicillium occitanis (nom. inval.)]PCG90391.1 hypothetical protein PENOC_102240 [Penicillium occitanis (nom. inval.)]
MFPSLRSSEAKYTSLDGNNSEKHDVYRHATNTVSRFWREAVIFFLAIVCAVLALENVYYPVEKTGNRVKVPEYQLTSQDTHWRQFQWYSGIYSSPNPEDEQAVNEAWDRIIAAHGIVAVDHEWAATHQLPDTMNLPSDSSKGVYIIDAYAELYRFKTQSI